MGIQMFQFYSIYVIYIYLKSCNYHILTTIVSPVVKTHRSEICLELYIKKIFHTLPQRCFYVNIDSSLKISI